MGTTRHIARRQSRAKLNALQEMELWLGVCQVGPTFASEQARRAAWLKHEPRLMARWGSRGRRPFGWWRYSAPYGLRRHFPGPNRERSMLWEWGLLAPEEKLQLEQEWCAAFDEALAPNFSLCVGEKVLRGFEAAIEHLIFCDVPPALVAKWERELAWRERTGGDGERRDGDADGAREREAVEHDAGGQRAVDDLSLEEGTAPPAEEGGGALFDQAG